MNGCIPYHTLCIQEFPTKNYVFRMLPQINSCSRMGAKYAATLLAPVAPTPMLRGKVSEGFVGFP